MYEFLKYLDKKYGTNTLQNQRMQMNFTPTDDYYNSFNSQPLFTNTKTNINHNDKKLNEAKKDLSNLKLKNTAITGKVPTNDNWLKDTAYKFGRGALDILGRVGNAVSGILNEPLGDWLDIARGDKNIDWKDIFLPANMAEGLWKGVTNKKDYYLSDNLRKAEDTMFGTNYLDKNFGEMFGQDPNAKGFLGWLGGLDTASILGFAGEMALPSSKLNLIPRFGRLAPKLQPALNPNISKEILAPLEIKVPRLIPSEDKMPIFEEMAKQLANPKLSPQKLSQLQRQYAQLHTTPVNPRQWFDDYTKPVVTSDRKGLEWLNTEIVPFNTAKKLVDNPFLDKAKNTKVGQATVNLMDKIGSSFNRGWQKAGQIADVKNIPKWVDTVRHAGNVDLNNGLEALRATLKSDPIYKQWTPTADKLASLLFNSPAIQRAVNTQNITALKKRLEAFNSQFNAGIDVKDALTWITDPIKFKAMQNYLITYLNITLDAFDTSKKLGLVTDAQFRPNYVRQRTSLNKNLTADDIKALNNLDKHPDTKYLFNRPEIRDEVKKLKAVLNAKDTTKLSRTFDNFDKVALFNEFVKETLRRQGIKFDKNVFNIDEFRSSQLLGDMYQKSAQAIQNRRLLDILKKNNLISSVPKDDFVPANFSAGKGSETVYMHKDAWAHLADLMSDPKSHSIEKIRNVTKSFYDIWKPLATVVKPSFTVGNKVDNIIKSWMAGYDGLSMIKNTKLVGNILNPSKKGTITFKKPVQLQGYKITEKGKLIQSNGSIKTIDKLTYDQFRTLLKYEGIADTGRFGFHGDMEQTIHEMIDEVVYNKIQKNPIHAMRQANNYLENRDKVGLFLHALTKGQSTTIAKQTVDKWLFNYNDLTNFERLLRDTVTPFYTFTRKTTPLMMNELFTNPNNFVRLGMIENKSENYAKDKGLEVSNHVPDYIKDRQGFRLPWNTPDGKAQYFNLPMSINEAFNGATGMDLGRQAWQMKSPLLNLPMGIFNNDNTWGGEIDYNAGYGKTIASLPEQALFEGISRIGGTPLLNALGIQANGMANTPNEKWVESKKLDFIKDSLTGGDIDLLDKYLRGGLSPQTFLSDISNRFGSGVDYAQQQYRDTQEDIRGMQGMYNSFKDMGYPTFSVNDIPKALRQKWDTYQQLSATNQPIPEDLAQELKDWFYQQYMKGRR